jgi:hypothetical protein
VLYGQLEGGRYSNMYSITVLNKTFESMPVEIKLISPAEGDIRPIGDFTSLDPQTIKEGRFLLILPASSLSGPSTQVEFAVMSGDVELERIRSSFIGPQPQ